VLGKVLIHLDPRPFAPSVKATGLIQRVYESFDILAVAAAAEAFHRVGKLSCPGYIIVQQAISFLTRHHGATRILSGALETFEAVVQSSLEKHRGHSLAAT